MEVVQVSLFFKQKLTVVMIDLTMACTISKFFPRNWVLYYEAGFRVKKVT